MRYYLLGPVEVLTAHGRISPGGKVTRTLLAALLLDANRVVSAPRLARMVWGAQEQQSEKLYVPISRLRRLLRENSADHAEVLVRRGDGYLLRTGPDEIDLQVFTDLVRTAENRDPARTVAALREALALWQTPILGGVTAAVADLHRPRLEEIRLGVVEDYVNAEFALGHHRDVVPQLQSLVATHPRHERLHALLIRALHLSGRDAEALDVYAALRQRLVRELGSEPGQHLTRLHMVILRGERAGAGADQPTGRTALDPGAQLDRPERSGSSEQPAAGRQQGDPIRAGYPLRPAELPACVLDFTGRADEMSTLDEFAVADPAAPVTIAITGPAGMGKTALAVHWARHAADRFPDGHLYVELDGSAGRPVGATDALAGLLRSLGVPNERVPAEERAAAALYRSLLAGRRMLVVLDNARDGDHVAALLPGEPRCLVVVTSRDRLTGLIARNGARRLTLGALSAEEAVMVVERVVGSRRVLAEPEATRQLAGECSRLPLGLRIAAANLADQPDLSIAGYVALVRADRIATAAGAGGAVRALLARSLLALTPDAQHLFRLLGLLPRHDVTAEAAAALEGTTPTEAGRLLSLLAAAQLIYEHAPGRYTLHDLLRDYARESVKETCADTSEELQRLYDWYIGAADAAASLLCPEILRLPDPGPPPVAAPPEFATRQEARLWLDTELPNLVATVRHTAAQGPPSVAWRLGAALRGYFWMGALVSEWLDVANCGRQAAQASGAREAEAISLISIAMARSYLGDYPGAVSTYEQALTATSEAGWPDGEATAAGNIGLTYVLQGRYREAVSHISSAVRLNRQIGRPLGVATGLVNLGFAFQPLGRLTDSSVALHEGLLIFRGQDSAPGQAWSLHGLGVTAELIGRPDRAMDLLTAAREMYRELGDQHRGASALLHLAVVHADAGRHDQAFGAAHQALQQTQDVGQMSAQARAQAVMAQLLLRVGRGDEARVHAQEALLIAAEIGHQASQAEAMIALAGCSEPADALGHAESALVISRDFGYELLAGDALVRLARAHQSSGHQHAAIATAREAVSIYRRTGRRLGQAHALTVLACGVRGLHGEPAAVRYFRSALEIFTELGTPAPAELRKVLDHSEGPARLGLGWPIASRW
jgi:DNA-binding SARP family transcriptional activator/tetratricopeptide (TPR) repeat protein